jgi:predicted CDP-diglyceride synthetase/phosphatidate cytidylyltransferase
VGEKVSLFVFFGVLLIIGGVVSYFSEKRRRGTVDVRRFSLQHGALWLFAAAVSCSIEYPRLRWLYFVGFGVAALSYAIQIIDWRRTRNQPMAGGENRASRRLRRR